MYDPAGAEREARRTQLERIRRYHDRGSAIFAPLVAITIGAPISLFVWQCWQWLKTASWPAVSVRDGLAYCCGGFRPTGFAGLDWWLNDKVLDGSLALALFVVLSAVFLVLSKIYHALFAPPGAD